MNTWRLKINPCTLKWEQRRVFIICTVSWTWSIFTKCFGTLKGQACNLSINEGSVSLSSPWECLVMFSNLIMMKSSICVMKDNSALPCIHYDGPSLCVNSVSCKLIAAISITVLDMAPPGFSSSSQSHSQDPSSGW